MNTPANHKQISNRSTPRLAFDHTLEEDPNLLGNQIGNQNTHIPNLPEGIPITNRDNLRIEEVRYFPEVPIPEFNHQLNFYPGEKPLLVKSNATHDLTDFKIKERGLKKQLGEFIPGSRNGDDIRIRIDEVLTRVSKNGSVSVLTPDEIDDYMKSIWQAVHMAEVVLKEEGKGGRVVIEASEAHRSIAEVMGMSYLMQPAKPFTGKTARKFLKDRYDPDNPHPLIGHCIHAPQGTRLISPQLIWKTFKEAAKADKLEESKDSHQHLREKVAYLVELLNENKKNKSGRREAELLVIKSSSGEFDRSKETYDKLYNPLIKINKALEQDSPSLKKLNKQFRSFMKAFIKANHTLFRENFAITDLLEQTDLTETKHPIDNLRRSIAIRYAQIARDDDLAKKSPHSSAYVETITLGRCDCSDPNNIHFRADKLPQNSNLHPDDLRIIAEEIARIEAPNFQKPIILINAARPEGKGLRTIDPPPKELQELKAIPVDNRIIIKVSDGLTTVLYEIELNVFHNPFLEDRYPNWKGLRILGDQAFRIPQEIKEIQSHAVNRLFNINRETFQLLTVNGLPESKWRFRRINKEEETGLRGDHIQKSKWQESDFLSWAKQIAEVYATNLLLGRSTSETEIKSVEYDSDKREYQKIVSDGIWYALFNPTGAKTPEEYRAKSSASLTSYLTKHLVLIETLYKEKLLTGDSKDLKQEFLDEFFESFQKKVKEAVERWPEVKKEIEDNVGELINRHRREANSEAGKFRQKWADIWADINVQTDEGSDEEYSLEQVYMGRENDENQEDEELDLPDALNILKHLDLVDKCCTEKFALRVERKTNWDITKMEELYTHVLSNLHLSKKSPNSLAEKTEATANSLDYLIRDAINCGITPSSVHQHLMQCHFEQLTFQAKRAFLVLLRISLRDIISTQSNNVSSIAEIKNDDYLNTRQIESLFKFAWDCRPADNSEDELKKQEGFFIAQVKFVESSDLCLTDSALKEVFRALCVATHPLAAYEATAQKTMNSINTLKQYLDKLDPKLDPKRYKQVQDTLEVKEKKMDELERNLRIANENLNLMTFGTYVIDIKSITDKN